MAIEMKDSDSDVDFDESLGIATYSNSQRIVNTYEIIFLQIIMYGLNV
ncbi:MAG: hypothetical protein P0116_09585 [Candidatus Nitrosocosmicus sp.]|nr:hypothetical protein [Candidatus Nitrosocosmicus sp.]